MIPQSVPLVASQKSVVQTICNSQGMYRTAEKSGLQKELDAINNSTKPADGELKVYPNPASNYLNIAYNFKQPQDAIFELYNNLGQLLISQKLDASINFATVKLGSLANGVYHYRVQTKLDRIYKGNIVIE